MLVTVGGQRVTVVFGFKVHGFSSYEYLLLCTYLCVPICS